ncbi:MAG TPA: succinylglutamate desuccinylase [Rhodospirillaceae bacterium]|nr:succinylglutamate desuccinylase [Rhodospirillaceae bacterium]|tara:strand:+ start:1925 stop:2878 length:954 start_codon:yes stop_codon:yes gene_type:complete
MPADAEYPVQLEAPDISPYKAGNTGIDYITSFEAAEPGPHVMITAVVHGNELCGAIALDWLMKLGVRPKRGRLSLGFMNVAAYTRFDPAEPLASRFVEEDFNRLWDAETLDGPRQSVELTRAREVRPFLDTVDRLLDIHSMQHATGALMLSGPLDKGRRLAEGTGVPELVVMDEGHAAGRRMRDYADFRNEASPKDALLVECGQHWEKSSEDMAKETALRFLLYTGAVDMDFAGPHLGPPPPKQKIVEVTHPVTITTDRFRFAEDYRGLETIAKAGTVLGYDGDDPVVTPHDDCVLIMPSRRLNRGGTAVRLARVVG